MTRSIVVDMNLSKTFGNVLLLSFSLSSPIADFGHYQIVGPLEVEYYKTTLERNRYCIHVESSTHQQSTFLVSDQKFNQNRWVDDTSDDNPCDVKANRDQLDSDGNDRWQVNCPWRETLLVEDTTSNEEPCVDFDNEERTHDETQFDKKIGDKHVKDCGNVMLNDCHRGPNTLREENDPEQIHDKVCLCIKVEYVEPLSCPRIFWFLALRHIEKHVPIPIHYVENNHWNLLRIAAVRNQFV